MKATVVKAALEELENRVAPVATRQAWVSKDHEAWFDGGLKTEGGKDVEITYEVTCKFVVSATAPITRETMAQLVQQRIEAAGGIEEDDVDGAEIIGIGPL